MMTTRLPSAGPITPRSWWRRGVAAFAAALLAQLAALLALYPILSAPWNTGAPLAVAGAVFFAYHEQWWQPRWRRATLAQLAALVLFGLAVVAVSHRRGWWRSANVSAPAAERGVAADGAARPLAYGTVQRGPLRS